MSGNHTATLVAESRRGIGYTKQTTKQWLTNLLRFSLHSGGAVLKIRERTRGMTADDTNSESQ